MIFLDILFEPQEFCKKEIKIINIDKTIFFFHISLVLNYSEELFEQKICNVI